MGHVKSFLSILFGCWSLVQAMGHSVPLEDLRVSDDAQKSATHGQTRQCGVRLETVDGAHITLSSEQCTALASGVIARHQAGDGPVALTKCPQATKQVTKLLADLLFSYVLDESTSFLDRLSLTDLSHLFCLVTFLECPAWIERLDRYLTRCLVEPKHLRASVGEELSLPDTLRARLTAALLGHQAQPRGEFLKKVETQGHRLNCVAVTPDGSRVLVGSDDRIVHVYDVASAEQINALTGHAGNVECMVLSAHCYLFTGSLDGTVRFWNLRSGRCERVFNAYKSAVVSMALSPDEKFLIMSANNGPALVLDTDRFESVHTLKGEGSFWAVAWGPHATQVVTGGNDRRVCVWDLQTETYKALEGHTGFVFCVAVSPDRTLIASGAGDGTVRLWDATTYATLKVLAGHTDAVGSLSFTPDGRRLVTGATDRTVRVWDVATGACTRTLTGHTRPVTASAATDNTVLSVADDGALQIANIARAPRDQVTLEHCLLALKIRQGFLTPEQLVNSTLASRYRTAPLALRNTLALQDPHTAKALSSSGDCHIM